MEFNHSALDTETLALVQPQQEESNTQPTEETKTWQPESEGNQEEQTQETQEEQIAEEEVETTPEATTVNIEGIGEVTHDELKEWKQGYLRQDDYTKKTQELARQREEVSTAVEVFEYLQQNPELVEQLRQADVEFANQSPQDRMLKELYYNQKSLEIDRQIERLKSTYGEFDETELFNKAAKWGMDDLEEAYKIIAFENMQNSNQQSTIEQAKQELKQELESQRNSLKTVVKTNSSAPVVNKSTLTPDERRIAAAMGMSEADYAKWK